MGYFDFFSQQMKEKFDQEAAKLRKFNFLFEVENCNEAIEVHVAEGKLSFSTVDDADYDNYELVIATNSEIYDRIISDEDELTGVDAYFAGDLETMGDRSYLEDLFEVFGIV